MNIYLQLGMVMFLLVMVRAAQQISVTGYHWWRIPVIGLAFAYLSVWEFGNLRHVFGMGVLYAFLAVVSWVMGADSRHFSLWAVIYLTAGSLM